MLVALGCMVGCLLDWRTGRLQLTFSIGAPECYNPDRAIESCPSQVRQNVDVWSLGCVLSEAAVWVVYGFEEGVLRYREQRKLETAADPRFQDGSCFHDGHKVLNAVKAQHATLQRDIRASDHVTKTVLEHLVDNMLVGDPKYRSSADFLHNKALGIIQTATDGLKLSGGDPSGPQQIRPRTPPELPTDLGPSPFLSRLRTPPRPIYNERAAPSLLLEEPDRIQTCSPDQIALGVANGHNTVRTSLPTWKASPDMHRTGLFMQTGHSGLVRSDSLRPIQERGHGDDPQIPQPVLAPQHPGRSSTSREFGSDTWNHSQSRLSSAGNLRSSVWGVSSHNRIANPAPLSDPQTLTSRSDTENHPLNLHSQQRISRPPASPALDPPKLSVASALEWKRQKKTGDKNARLNDDYLLSNLNKRDHVCLVSWILT